MGILLVLMPMMSFIGGLFWSMIVDRTGSYRGVLTTTSLLGVAAVFGYLLPQVATSSLAKNLGLDDLVFPILRQKAMFSARKSTQRENRNI